MRKYLLASVAAAVLVSLGTATLPASAATYILRGDTTTNLGFDGTANLPTAQSTGTAIPYRGSLLTTTATGISWRPTSIPAATNSMIDGYTAVYSANPVTISAISSSCAVRNGANTDIWRFFLYDYNPMTGTRTLMATSTNVTGIAPGTTTAAVPSLVDNQQCHGTAEQPYRAPNPESVDGRLNRRPGVLRSCRGNDGVLG